MARIFTRKSMSALTKFNYIDTCFEKESKHIKYTGRPDKNVRTIFGLSMKKIIYAERITIEKNRNHSLAKK